MAEQPSTEKEVFNAARHIVDGAERVAFVHKMYGREPAAMRRILELLRVYEEDGSFLEVSPVARPAAGDAALDERPGTVIGPYTLLAQIGEGGFAVVFLAEQTEPVRRKVALKVLKPGMDTRQIVARFEAERQALALMDHPGIARVLDGGATPSGRPYFVMDLVEGAPITEFCAQNHLTTRQRLELFSGVCQAVQHAHQKGIIHRDLKPSNILVVRHDTTPLPKVIDFGVAKALAQDLTDKTLFTGFTQMVGTPLYMSPEQAGQSGLDIDTRSDIYSLGVLLYELLTGTTPFASKRFKEAGYDEMRRIIREEEPARPSTRLSESQDTMPALAAQRLTEPARLTRLLRGELDWIVMKALEKDRNRRYQTASDFALDVQRYLADEPVRACPPSLGYRLGKFVRRNRGPVLAGVLVLLALVAGIVGTTLGLIHADQQRQLARQSQRAAEEAQARAEEATAAEARQRALAIAQRNAADAARLRTREALDLMTSAFTGDSLLAQQEIRPLQKKFLTEVLDYYQEFAGEKADDELARKRVAAAAYRLGFIEFRLGRTLEALAAFGKAHEGYAALASDFPAEPVYRQERARTHNNVGVLLKNLDRHAEAEAQHRQALRILGELAEEKPVPVYRQELARSHYGLGILLAARWQPTADAQYRRALALQEKLVQEFPAMPAYRQELARSHHSLGTLHADVGQPAQAEEHYREALALRQALLAEVPTEPSYTQELATTQHGLARLLSGLKKLAQAEELYRQALTLREKLAAQVPGNPAYAHELARTCDSLALLLNAQERRAEAEEQCRKAWELRRKLVAQSGSLPGHRHDLGFSCVHLGIILHGLGRHAEALEQYRAGVALFEKLAAESPGTPDYRQHLGSAHVFLGNLLGDLRRPTEAETALRRALSLHEELSVGFPDRRSGRKDLAHAHTCLGNLLKDLGRLPEAQEHYRKAAAVEEKVVP